MKYKKNSFVFDKSSNKMCVFKGMLTSSIALVNYEGYFNKDITTKDKQVDIDNLMDSQDKTLVDFSPITN